jgi:hypothetical protein
VDEAIYLGDRLIVLGSSPGRVIADLPVPLARPRERLQSARQPQPACAAGTGGRDAGAGYPAATQGRLNQGACPRRRDALTHLFGRDLKVFEEKLG